MFRVALRRHRRPRSRELLPHAPFAALELVPDSGWPLLAEIGVSNVLAIPLYGEGGPAPFEIGFGTADRALHARVMETAGTLLAKAARYKVPKLLGFIGNGEPNQDTFDRSVKSLREIAPVAEKLGVTIVVEMLNTIRFPDTEPMAAMKGHPGYAGNDGVWVGKVIEAVGSSAVQLLYDTYHVKLTHGDPLHE